MSQFSPFEKCILYFLNVDELLQLDNISEQFKNVLSQYKSITSDIFGAYNFLQKENTGILNDNNTNSTLFVQILNLISDKNIPSLNELMDKIQSIILNTVKESKINNEELFLTLLLFLYIYLQENVWGPSFIFIKETEKVDFEKEVNKIYDNYFNNLIKDNLLREEEILKELTININEEIYKHSKFIIFYYIPYFFLIQNPQILNQNFSEFYPLNLWKIRILFILSKLIYEPVEFLKKQIDSLYKEIDFDNSPKFQNDNKLIIIQGYLQIEKSFVQIKFYNYKECVNYIDKAKETLNLNISLTGKMGKKTKYQDFETPVLVVSVENDKKKEEENEMKGKEMEYQNSVTFLPDNPLLDKPKLTNPDEEKYFSGQLITIKDQIYISALLNYLTRGLPDEDMNREVILSYAEKGLKTSYNWLVYSKLLLHRSLAENKSTKKMERALLQIESICNQFNDREPIPYSRMEYFFIIDYPMIFNIKKRYAELFMSYGAVLTAYGIFKELQMWEDAIKCLYVANNRPEAKDLANEVLSKHQEPGIYCILGELENKEEHFLKALEISNNKYTRAYRCLGKYYNSNKEEDKAIECYEKALSSNSLFPNIWFSLGFLYLKKNNYERAATCFTTILSLDDSDKQVWGNLGFCFSKLKKQKEALKCFEEGYAKSRQDYKMLDNLAMTAIELKELNKVLFAIEQFYFIDQADKLKTGYFYYMVRIYLDNLKTYDEHNRNFLAQKIFGVFDLYSAKDGLKSEVWDLYALFIEEIKFNKVDQTKLTQLDRNNILKEIIEVRLKEIRTLTLQIDWVKNIKLRDIVRNVCKLIRAICNSIVNEGNYVNDKNFFCSGIEHQIEKQEKIEKQP